MMMLRPCTSLLRQSSFGGVSSSALMGGWLAHSSYSLLRRCSLATTASTPPHAHPSPSSSFSQSNSQFPLKRNSSNNNKNNSNNVINRKTQSNSASAAVKRNNPKSNTSSSPLQPKELMKRLIHIRRISRATGGGKKRSIWALVIVGNGNGSAGYGEGRALDATNAVNKATRDAMKNMIYIDRLDNRTIFSDIKHKFQSVELSMHTQPAGKFREDEKGSLLFGRKLRERTVVVYIS